MDAAPQNPTCRLFFRGADPLCSAPENQTFPLSHWAIRIKTPLYELIFMHGTIGSGRRNRRGKMANSRYILYKQESYRG